MISFFCPKNDVRFLNDGETRPWGEFTNLCMGKGWKCKLLVVKKGQCTSLQSHKNRDEFWFVLQGKGEITLGKSAVRVKRFSRLFVPKKVRHRICNVSRDDLVILELWFGRKLAESDITRFEDSYGRVR